MGQEFVRVGYYVRNDYENEQLKEEPPQKILIDEIQRNILSNKPRLTKCPINCHPEDTATGGPSPPAEHAAAADEQEEQIQPSRPHP